MKVKTKLLLVLFLGCLFFGFAWNSQPWNRSSTLAKTWGAGTWGTAAEDAADTYWNTAYGDMWTETYVTDSRWAETYNTEI